MASQESLSSDEADEQSVLMTNPPPEYSENPLPGEGQQPREQFLSASGARPQAWRPQDDNNMVSPSTKLSTNIRVLLKFLTIRVTTKPNFLALHTHGIIKINFDP